MSKKRTLDEFIEQAKIAHGDKYDYSKVAYINNTTKVCIICPIHGEFWQTPKQHIRGEGCPKCSYKKRGEERAKTKEEFFQEFAEKHSEKLVIKESDYIDYNTKIPVICKEHGIFYMSPARLIYNSDCCPKCAQNKKIANKKYTTEKFVELAKERYGSKYSYQNANYVNSRTKLVVTCPEHGDFNVLPATFLNDLNKEHCPFCREEKKHLSEAKNFVIKRVKKNHKEKERKEKEKNFINNATSKHNGKYDYSKTRYINSHEKVCIICPEHGEFWQSPNNHLRGCGCPKCANEKASLTLRYTKEEFIKNAKKIHGDKYDYSKVEYVNNSTKVCIICPEHGEFWQTPAMHYNEKQGCPNCGVLSSKPEIEILEFVKNIYSGEVVSREKNILKNRELDIYLPEKKIGIEFDGLRWHSELFKKDKNYHLKKTEQAKTQGISLLHVFEDEWVYKQDIVKKKIAHILGVNKEKKIHGRKCTISEIKKDVAYEFLKKNHIQGSASSTLAMGAFFEDRLIAVMTFLKEHEKWTLNRFATDNNYIVNGIAGRLFAYFRKVYNPKIVYTFADRRWTTNKENLYTKIGFLEDIILPPSYYYVTDLNSFRKRYHKFGFRKKILHKKYNLPLTMSEREMTEKIHYYRIYDCGLIRYVWKNNI